jgi:hypothetical protein
MVSEGGGVVHGYGAGVGVWEGVWGGVPTAHSRECYCSAHACQREAAVLPGAQVAAAAATCPCTQPLYLGRLPDGGG